ncbi:MAG: trypsin-like peptidase domain-containing protein, partial [Oscillospiraceae bacterium]|nr:trypsin-like peptidase domain-containing protein [Oscillospiraceae bacterium]
GETSMENYENTYCEEAQQEQPAETQPAETQPAETQPAETQPAETQPVDSYSAPVEPAPTPVRKKRKKNKFWKALLAAVLIITLVVTCCGITAVGTSIYWKNQLDKTAASMRENVEDLRNQLTDGSHAIVIKPDGDTASGEMSPAQVYAENVKATVAISCQGHTTNIFGQISETASSGSGFIISADGYVVTNFHVISGSSRVGVILSDGKEHQATVVGYDKTNDVAVLKIEGDNFPCVAFGSSDALVVGERVAAIGNPLGELSSTLTVGYVSAKDRTVNTEGSYQNMIQTDAAINSGNSGGPLFNMRGEVIGITTAKYSGTSASGATIEGIGFAIPIDDVRNLIDDLTEFGHIKSGYLGIVAQDVNREISDEYGVPLGARVLEVTPGSCAERAGIKAKDIITNLGGKKVESMADLTRALSKYQGGEEVTVTVYRNGGETVLTITLDAKPVEQEQTQEPVQQETQPEAYLPDSYLPGSIFPDWFPFG